MIPRRLRGLLGLLILVLFTGSVTISAQDKATRAIDSKADDMLRAMSALLISTPTLTFKTTEVHDRVRRNGEKIFRDYYREAKARAIGSYGVVSPLC